MIVGLVLGLAWSSLVVHSQLSLAGVQAAVFQVVEVAGSTYMSLKAVDIDRKRRVRWCTCISPFGQSTHRRHAVLAFSIGIRYILSAIVAGPEVMQMPILSSI